MNHKTVNYIHQIVEHLLKAQEIATAHGYNNLFQPGMVKELVIGDLLGHEVHRTKHALDACDPSDSSIKYEYLSCVKGGTFQFDRMFKSPVDKRNKSLSRITRNSAIFCVVFDKEHPLTIQVIYQVAVDIMLQEAERQLDASKNSISHVGFSIKWCQTNGKIIYSNVP